MLNTYIRPRAPVAAVPPLAAAAQTSADELLVERIASGDRLAMQALFARHRTSVYRWLLRFVSDATLAEDLLSEVFLDVWRQAGRFEGRSSVATWLLSIARYKALSWRAVAASMRNSTSTSRPRSPTPRTIRKLRLRKKLGMRACAKR